MSSAAALLPPVARPPHDPLTIVLDQRVGWSVASMSGVEIAPDASIALAPAPHGTRPLASDDGSFGGLCPPDNVALGPECIVLLLDRKDVVLKRFDACECAFVKIPCIAGAGSGPRQLAQPGGMITSCGNLYICDGGNARVQVFSLRGLVLRAIWTAPTATPWRPVAIAADSRGRLYVGDPDSGSVYVFNARGRYLRALPGLGAITHLTIDCADRLYVQTQASDVVLRVDPATGAVIDQQTRADEVADAFGPLPFVVTPSGHLRFDCGEFDEDGDPAPPVDDVGPIYQQSGTLVTQALDSVIHRCLWDRLAIEGDFPDGTSVRAFVYSAETALPDAIVADLLPDAWSPVPALEGPQTSPWDAMLRAAPGRYLWLRLELAGDGHVTPRLRKIRLKFPRISLRRYLPGTFGSDPLAAEFTDRFLAIFDRELRRLESVIDWQAHFYDPLSAPANDDDRRRDFLSWLASWIGVTLDRSWPLERRRRYLKHVGALFGKRGTLPGLEQNLRLFLGLPEENDCPPCPPCGPCTPCEPPRWQPPKLVLEHYRLRRWLFVGRGRLGEQARLWGESIVNRSRLGGQAGGRGTARIGVTRIDTTLDPLRDPFHVYAHKFTVFAPASCARSPSAQRGLERLIRAERPAHTAYQIVYVEPRFRIGIQSMIGFDSAIGCYPDGGIRLAQSQLGKATVLGGDGALTVGKNARIGTTTRLE
jgi:phage tail-like protein